MRWIIAAGIAGAILEGLVWMAIFMSLAGKEVNVVALAVGGIVSFIGLMLIMFSIAVIRRRR